MNQRKQQQFNNTQERVQEIKKKIQKTLIQQPFCFWQIMQMQYLRESLLQKNLKNLNLFQFPYLLPTNKVGVKVQKPKNWFDDIPILVGVDEITQSEICSICLQEINEKNIIKILQCNHYFHNDCIKEWVLKKAECPTCRDKIHQQ